VLRHLALLAAGLSVVFAQAVFRSGPPVTAVIALVAASRLVLGGHKNAGGSRWGRPTRSSSEWLSS
jgi:hypothetical protein